MKTQCSWHNNRASLLSAVCAVIGLLWLFQGTSWGEPGETAAAPVAAPPAVLAAAAQPAVVRPAVVDHYGQLPLHFEPNQGQTAEEVKFLSRGPGYAVFLTPREVVWSLRSHDPVASAAAANPARAVVHMHFVGIDTQTPPVLEGLEVQPGRSNYFIGDDPKRWRTAIPHVGRVRYSGLYPGIALELYGNPQQLEYDFVVSPGADPGQIRLTFSGVEALRVDEQGQLILQVAGGELIHQAPRIYQVIDGERRPVAGQYMLQEPSARETAAPNETLPTIGFQVVAYDPNVPLVIDPGLVYSTYLGGSKYNEGNGIAVDTAGNAYVTGYTDSTDFPTNPVQSDNAGSKDIFVTKLDVTGQKMVYSTYVGGNSNDEGHAIAVDAYGYAYVTGYTRSNNFPTTSNFQSSQSSKSGVFVMKLDATGQTLYSAYLGASSSDVGYGIAVDPDGNAYVTGETSSSSFPTTLTAVQRNKAGSNDAFVTKLSADGKTLSYSTYLGGSGSDEGYGIAVDSRGYAYVTGATDSTNFPTDNPFQLDKGLTDAFVTKLDATGQTRVYSTYLGGSNNDRGYGIAVDATGNAYVTGSTNSDDFPVTLNTFQRSRKGLYDAFVTKLSADGKTLSYSTYLGGSSSDEGKGIALDAGNYAYITGTTNSTNFPIDPSTAHPGGDDAFVTRLDDAGRTLLYSTYLGGSGKDEGRGIAFADGYVYVTGTTASTDFPTLPQPPLQQGRKGSTDAFVAKLSFKPFLSVSVVSSCKGAGTVTSNPAGIDCSNGGNGGNDCNHEYSNNIVVTLRARPAEKSSFVGWSGACGGIDTDTCQITMTRDLAVRATFDIPPPGKASLLAPSGIINTATPSYRWQAAPSATWYYLWVNDASGNRIRQWYTAAQAGCASGSGECAVTPTVALQAGAGQWWVQTYSACGYGSWSNAMSFTVGPVPIAPTGTITPTYHWQAVPNATWYYLWVNDASGNRIKQWYTAAQVGCASGNSECTITLTVPLQRGTGQCWVQSYSASGYGSWNSGCRIDYVTPTYRWQAVPSATWYYLWVNDASGNRILQWYTAVQAGCGSGSGECAVTPTVALQPGAGQWRVQAYDATGYGPWSQGLSFVVP